MLLRFSLVHDTVVSDRDVGQSAVPHLVVIFAGFYAAFNFLMSRHFSTLLQIMIVIFY